MFCFYFNHFEFCHGMEPILFTSKGRNTVLVLTQTHQSLTVSGLLIESNIILLFIHLYR